MPEFSDTKDQMLDGVGLFIEWCFHRQNINEATALLFFFFNRLYIQSETEINFFFFNILVLHIIGDSREHLGY